MCERAVCTECLRRQNSILILFSVYVKTEDIKIIESIIKVMNETFLSIKRINLESTQTNKHKIIILKLNENYPV